MRAAIGRRLLLPVIALLFTTSSSVAADTSFQLVKSSDIFGSVTHQLIATDEVTLMDVAMANNLGYLEITAANPGIDPWYPKKDTEISVPTMWILPEIEECLSNLPGPFLTIQISSFWRYEPAREIYEGITSEVAEKAQQYLRLERSGPYYVVRTGLFADMGEAKKQLGLIRRHFPGALLVTSHVREGSILDPPALPPLPALAKKSKAQSCLVVNLAELRLYRLTWKEHGLKVRTYPIGIGKEGTETIQGRYRITEKLTNPTWIIPESVKDEFPGYRRAIPPGPNNPLGRHALRLSRPDYLIHGTNKPLGVGRRVSHGCIRMYPEDIEELYSLAQAGEEVIILYQPVKIGERCGVPYIEVHEDYLKDEDSAQLAVSLLQKHGLFRKADLSLMFQAVQEKRGVPVSLRSGPRVLDSDVPEKD